MIRPDWFNTFRNVTEYVEPVELKRKSGTVPRNVRGTYYKCGPGVFGGAHPFDGDGVVSAYNFTNGTVTYQSRIVNTMHRIAEQKAGRRLYSGAFGTPPLWKQLKNPANTNVVAWGGVLIVFCESGAPYLMDPKTLKTIGTMPPFTEGIPLTTGSAEIDGMFKSLHLFGDVVGAHPKVVDGDETLVLYTLQYKHNKTIITFYELNKMLSIIRKKPYEVDGFLYVHDFIVTPTHYVFFQDPLRLDYSKASNGLVNCLQSRPNAHGTVHAVPRDTKTGSLATAANIAPGFVTHHASVEHSLKEGVIDINSVMYPSCFDFRKLSSKSRLVRTQLNMNGKVTQEEVFNYPIEFPSSYEGSAIFATSGTHNVQQCLVKMHVKKQQLHEWDEDEDRDGIWDAGPMSFIGEPVLDKVGHVFAIIHDVTKTRSHLAIFDEHNITKGPVAELWLPEHVPTTLHGHFTTG